MKKRVFFGIAALIVAMSFIGCEEEKKDKDPLPGYKLTVTDITEQGITGGSLLPLTQQGPGSVPVAAAMNINGTFEFFEPVSSTNPMPDSNKPFRADGTYAVALAKITDFETFQPKKTWIYLDQQSATLLAVTVSGDFSLAFNKFVDQTQLSQILQQIQQQQQQP